MALISLIFDRRSLIVVLSVFGFFLFLPIQGAFVLKVFLERFRLQPRYFSVVQVLYLIWNAINDPLLGYMQDVGCGWKWIMDRRKVILYAGPVFVGSFLLFWFPWTPDPVGHPLAIAAQYFVVLFISDTLLTLVFSAYCGLCVELSVDRSARIRIFVYGEMAMFLCTFILFPVNFISDDLNNFFAFQMCCIAIAVVACICVTASGYFMPKTAPAQISLHDDESAMQRFEVVGGEETIELPVLESKAPVSLKQGLIICWSIVRGHDFLCVVLGQFSRLLRLSANDATMNIVVPLLISVYGDVLPLGSVHLSAFYFYSRSLSHVLFFALWPLSNAIGPWSVTYLLAALSVINCVVAMFIGRHCFTCLAAFICVESILTRCGAHTFYMYFMGDVIDDDYKRNKRQTPLSTLIFTLKALLSKPAEQLGPLITAQLMFRAYYDRYNSGTGTFGERCGFNETINADWGHLSAGISFNHTQSSVLSASECTSMQDSMFLIITIFPLCCIALEALAMLPYRQKFKHQRNLRRSKTHSI